MKTVKIMIEIEVPDGTDPEVLDQVAANCFVQVESLEDDFGVKYGKSDYHVDQGEDGSNPPGETL